MSVPASVSIAESRCHEGGSGMEVLVIVAIWAVASCPHVFRIWCSCIRI